MRFDTVVIGARDVSALAAFYETTFGLKRVSSSTAWNDPEGSVRMELPNFQKDAPDFLFVSAVSDEPQELRGAEALGYTHICFETGNVRALYQKILDNGGTTASLFEKPLNEHTLYTRDPEGNLLEIHIPAPETKSPAVLKKTIAALLRTKTGLGTKADPKPRFLHVNIVTPDWENSSNFYEAAFGGHQLGDQRDYHDDYIATLVGIREPIKVVGRHITMPGDDVEPVTVEIFTYSKPSDRKPAMLTDCGILCQDFSGSHTEYETLLAAGAEVQSEENGVKILEDPDGNLFRWKFS